MAGVLPVHCHVAIDLLTDLAQNIMDTAEHLYAPETRDPRHLL
jgi:hypothetical protein